MDNYQREYIFELVKSLVDGTKDLDLYITDEVIAELGINEVIYMHLEDAQINLKIAQSFRDDPEWAYTEYVGEPHAGLDASSVESWVEKFEIDAEYCINKILKLGAYA